METEGTNECLADLQDRCGPGVFPPRAGTKRASKDQESRKIFRILRERRSVLFLFPMWSLSNGFFLLVDLGRFGSELLGRKNDFCR